MATASAGLAPLVTGNSSSFGQFRLTQFVDNAPRPPNAISDPLQTAVLTSNRDSDPDQMAQSSRPSLGQIIDRIPSAVGPRPMAQDQNRSNASPIGFGTLELVELPSNPILEGILGPNKDGRVRNPVPSKLKGKTDNKQGNFGVMHMGMSPGKKSEAQGRDAAAERDAAARRTSENTASRAKAAQQEKYVPPKKRTLEGNGGQPSGTRGSPLAQGPDHKQRGRPLAPDETKFEQARLLTLLRSINPVTVVDQICKAVAYFGGIPGAPPPEDGIFPESANTRETGALFIGWLSEIFPNLSSPEVPRMQDLPSGGKKGKGRQSKGNKDTPANEPPNPRNGFGFGQAVSAPAWGLPQSLSLVNTIGMNAVPAGGQAISAVPEQDNQREQQRPATPIKQQLEDGPSSAASASKRGRGRPKGSRNKGGKVDIQQSGNASGSTETGSQNQIAADDHAQQVLRGPTPQTSAEKNQSPYVQALTNPIGITRQPVHYQEQSWQVDSRKNHDDAASKAAPAQDELSPEELAVLNAFRNHGPPAAAVVTPHPTQPPGKSSTGAGSGVKRKRAPPKPKPNVAAPQAPQAPQNHIAETQQHVQPALSVLPVQPVQNTPILPPSKVGAIGVTKDALHWTPVDTASPTAPPAKRPRQRKPKVPGTNDPPSRTQTASIVSSSTPPTIPSTIPDSQATPSQQSLPVTRPPAEGLEAHYERFANSSNVPQQNGRSHTPSMASITPQQQLRQQQKPASVPPQVQQSPVVQQQQQQQQQQHQHQMQQQKSQQGKQREDQKVTQGSVKSSSTGFYSQPQRHGSATYSQQYPSHQPSQLYGTHTASPQMSNNSYRTTSSHTMTQASPQFSQAENTYRTASPHTIAQPSPSFSQPESNFRTSSTHSITQPSPTYSQPENSYRSTSSHSLTQPSTSYPRPPTQNQTSHQSHYGHFPEAPYVDLPTLESLGHSGSSGHASNVTMGTGSYGQGLGVGLGGTTSSTRPGSNSVYGTSSGLGNAFDNTGANDLLRGVSRPGSNSVYGTSSGLSNAFDTGAGDQEMRERLLRGLGRR